MVDECLDLTLTQMVVDFLRSLAFQSEPKGWKAVSASEGVVDSDRPFGPVFGAT